MEQRLTLRMWRSGVSNNYLSKRKLDASAKLTRTASVKPVYLTLVFSKREGSDLQTSKSISQQSTVVKDLQLA